MPEGDTVWRSCRRLHEVLAGRTLTRGELRVSALATTDLTRVAVREVVSRGKHQLFRLGNDHTLHTHFRMDGTWRIYPVGRRWSAGPEFQIRAVLATTEHSCVGYRLPVVELLPTADEHEVVGHLGPDLLGPDWDLEEAVRRVSADADRTTLVKAEFWGKPSGLRCSTCPLPGSLAMSLLPFPVRVLLPKPNASDWTFPSSVDAVATNPAIRCRRLTICSRYGSHYLTSR